MSRPPAGRLTEVNPEPDSGAELTSRHLLVFLFPVLVVGSVTVIVALVAALMGFQRDAMMLTAEGGIALLLLPTVLVAYREIVERREAVRALQNVQARVGGIVESAMDAIITIDESQRVVQFNAAAERAFRWPRTAVLGQRLDMLIPERFRGVHGEHVSMFAQTSVTSRGMGRQAVLAGLRADGSEFPIEASISQHVEDGHKLFTVILRDVTERVGNAAALERSESRLRGILESAMDAIITVDEGQHIVLFNKAAEEVFLCPRDEAVGAPLEWFIPERFRANHRELVRGFGETGPASRRMGHARVVRGLRRNGEEFPIEASISQIVERGQRFYTVILRDVTTRVAAEEALRQVAPGDPVPVARGEHRARAGKEPHRARTARRAGPVAHGAQDRRGLAARARQPETARGGGQARGDAGPARRHRGRGTAHRLRPAPAHARRPGPHRGVRMAGAELHPAHRDTMRAHAGRWASSTCPTPTRQPSSASSRKASRTWPSMPIAERVDVNLERNGEEIVLTVQDDGRGFDPARAPNVGSFGIIGLRERAYLVGGELAIESTPGRGTRVELRDPGEGAMIRIVVADDHTIVREGLKQLLGAAGDLEVVGEAATATKCWSACAGSNSTCCCSTCRCPARAASNSSSWCAPNARSCASSCSACTRSTSTRCARSAPAPPATSPRRAPPRQLVEAIRKVASGGAFISAEVAQQLALGAMPDAKGPLHAALSDREFQVFKLLVDGVSVTDIAERLHLSVKTVSTHKSNILQKMNMSSPAELIRYAIAERLVDDGQG